MRAFNRLLCAMLVLLAAALASPALRAQSFVQGNSSVAPSATTVVVTYTQAQVSGDLNIVVVGWKDTTATVSSVTDTAGNTYTRAVGPTVLSGQLSQSIYFAKNIAAAPAASNAVTVTFSASATAPDVRVLEYSGLDANNPVDGAAGASGNGSIPDSGAAATGNPTDLLIGASTSTTSTSSAGASYSARMITANGNLVEDQAVSTAGSYDATSTLSSPGSWVMQIAAFKLAGAPPAPSAPANLTASAVSSSQINLS
ncbi:MAG TPA: hypothetical protein VEH49_01700, partial [Methylomirabilota bacterium]|nr:hypothetical protein [Methylomirabilota bacterium]